MQKLKKSQIDNSTKDLKYILGLDLGIASVGWSVVSIDENSKPNALIDLGVRVFDPAENAKDGKSLNLGRRLARSKRRTLRRKANRIEELHKLFLNEGLITKNSKLNQEIEMTWVEIATNKIYTQKPKYYDEQKTKQSKTQAEFLPIGIWGWRLLGLEQKLEKHQWAGVLHHILKRRGYLSMRKSESQTEDKELGRLLAGVSDNSKHLNTEPDKYRSPAELAIKEFAKKGHLRNKAGDYSHTFDRLNLKKEIELLFEKQREFGNEYASEALQDAVIELLMFQKEALSGNALIKMLGDCTFEKGEKRAAKATYSFERFLWLQKLANLRILENYETRSLTLAEYNILLDEPYQKAKLTYSQVRKLLKLDNSAVFKGLRYADAQEKPNKKQTADKNKEQNNEQAPSAIHFSENSTTETTEQSPSAIHFSEKEKIEQIKGREKNLDNRKGNGALDEEILKETEKETFIEMKAYHQIRKALEKANLQDDWGEIKTKPELLDLIGTAFSIYKTDDDIRTYLTKQQKQEFSQQVLDALLQSLNFIKFGHLSLVALEKILKKLEWKDATQPEPATYDKVCADIYGDHYGLRNGAQNKLLPKIPTDSIVNPVVIRTLSQTRKVINAVINKYGSPAKVHIENARELGKSRKDRDADSKQQEKNRKDRIKAAESFKQLVPDFRGEPTGKDILKMRLYYAQNGQCVYSGKPINIKLLNEKDYVDVDHALPYSRTYDDSFNNKVLVLTGENQNKGNKTPFEWLDGKNNSEKWRIFKARILSCSFSPLKKHIILKASIDKEFLTRNINDTRFITRFLANFIADNLLLVGENKRNVFTPNGRITSMLRGLWGLAKNRDENNRHHALDAIVVACTQVAFQKSITDNAKRLNLELADLFGISQNTENTENVENAKKITQIKIESETESNSTVKKIEVLDLDTGEIKKKFYIEPPWKYFRDEVLIRVFDENPNGALAQKLPDRPEALHNFVRPLFVSRAPIRKLSGQAHLETTRSARMVEEKVGIIKKPLTKLKDKDIENIVGFREGREKQFYADLETRLKKFNYDAEKAFAEPFYKQGKSGIKQEVKSVKIREVQKSGLLLFKNTDDKQAYFENQAKQEILQKELQELEQLENSGKSKKSMALKAEQTLSDKNHNLDKKEQLLKELEQLRKEQILPSGIADNGDIVRTDVFEYTTAKGKTNYFLVPIYAWQVAQKILPNKAIIKDKTEEEWQEMTEEHKFKFSLYKNDLVKTQKDGKENIGYYSGVDRSSGAIAIKLQDMDKNKSEQGKGSIRISTKTLDNFEKYQVDILGNYYKVNQETRRSFT